MFNVNEGGLGELARMILENRVLDFCFANNVRTPASRGGGGLVGSEANLVTRVGTGSL